MRGRGEGAARRLWMRSPLPRREGPSRAAPASWAPIEARPPRRRRRRAARRASSDLPSLSPRSLPSQRRQGAPGEAGQEGGHRGRRQKVKRRASCGGSLAGARTPGGPQCADPPGAAPTTCNHCPCIHSMRQNVSGQQERETEQGKRGPTQHSAPPSPPSALSLLSLTTRTRAASSPPAPPPPSPGPESRHPPRALRGRPTNTRPRSAALRAGCRRPWPPP